eukprot:scaffold2631_cov412-Prasinococcus_capsulatus_cf.AAC.16
MTWPPRTSTGTWKATVVPAPATDADTGADEHPMGTHSTNARLKRTWIVLRNRHLHSLPGGNPGRELRREHV